MSDAPMIDAMEIPRGSGTPASGGGGPTARYFPGFELRVEYFHDDPIHDDTMAIANAQRDALEAHWRVAADAYRFFATGAHPFRRLLPYLDRKRDETAHAPAWSSDSVVTGMVMGVKVTFYVVPGTPQLIIEKLWMDFMLAQASRPGLATTKGLAFENETIRGVDNVQFELEAIINYAVTQPHEFAAIVGPHPADHEVAPAQSNALFRLRCLARAFAGQRFGPAWIAEAVRREELMFLLMATSDRDASDLGAIVAKLPPPHDYYRVLVPKGAVPAPTGKLGPPPPAH